MSTLHMLSHSPFSDTRLESCLRCLSSGDGVLLCGDAVYALNAKTAIEARLQQLPSDITLMALAEDVAARGLTVTSSRVQLLDYPAFVQSTLAFSKVNSWL